MISPRKLIGLSALLSVLAWSSASHAGVALVSDMTQEKVAQSGESYRGALTLSNGADVPAEAKIYQTDYTFSSDGSNQFGAPGQSARSNANWISLSRDVIVIPPKGTETVEFEVRVPPTKGMTGTYWSMIMVEPINSNSQESAADLPERTTRITQVTRYGVQVVTHIGNTGDSGLAFDNPALIKEDGGRLFVIDVTNTGQRFLNPRLWLELYSNTGSPVGKFETTRARLYPDTSVRFKFDLNQAPSGHYLGLVVADGTGDNLFGANVELEIE